MFSGQRLKEIREAQGMSQASVAKHLGISRSSYFNWENGKTKPNQKNPVSYTHLDVYKRQVLNIRKAKIFLTP